MTLSNKTLAFYKELKNNEMSLSQLEFFVVRSTDICEHTNANTGASVALELLLFGGLNDLYFGSAKDRLACRAKRPG